MILRAPEKKGRPGGARENLSFMGKMSQGTGHRRWATEHKNPYYEKKTEKEKNSEGEKKTKGSTGGRLLPLTR